MELKHSRLFQNTGIDTSPIERKQFPANYTIELEGDESTYIAVVLEGSIHVQAYTLSGHTITINTLTAGMIYGDVLLYGTINHNYPGNLITAQPTTIAVVPNDLVRHHLRTNTVFQDNFLTLLADKVYIYNWHSKLLSQDTIRDKILFYLHEEIRIQGANRIHLNMTKEELARKLYVQRPSLSRELAAMKQDGLIEYDRKTITLLAS